MNFYIDFNIDAHYWSLSIGLDHLCR